VCVLMGHVKSHMLHVACGASQRGLQQHLGHRRQPAGPPAGSSPAPCLPLQAARGGVVPHPMGAL
jgi:hypothetical protein